jgi:hypothetical protein
VGLASGGADTESLEQRRREEVARLGFGIGGRVGPFSAGVGTGIHSKRRRRHDPNGGLGPRPKNAPVEFVRTLADANGVRLEGECIYLQVAQPWLEHDQIFTLGLNGEGAVVVRSSDSELPAEQGWVKMRTWSIGAWEPHPEPLYNEQVAPTEMRLTDGRVIEGIVVVIPSGVE